MQAEWSSSTAHGENLTGQTSARKAIASTTPAANIPISSFVSRTKMGEAEAAPGDLIRRLNPSPATTSSRSAAVNPNSSAFFSPFGPSSFVSDTPLRPGIPPMPPSSSSAAFHSRPPSQPPAFFSLDSSPPPLSPPSPFSAHVDRARGVSSGLPPRKAHRRSQSDVPIGFFHPSSASPLTTVATAGSVSALLSQQRSQPSPKLVKQELEKDTESSGDGIGDRKSDGGDTAEDLFNAYMNLDCLETLNASQEDLNSSRLSGSRTNMADSSENEAESGVVESSGSGVKNEGNKMNAAGDPMPMTALHFRSLSMDGFMGNLHSGDESMKLLPSPGNQVAQLSRNGSMDGAANMVSSEFNGEFNSAEMKKIMTNEKLVEMTLTDPKRVKRILANRQSAARSKERKMRYISELEHKVQTLQTEATTLSAQLTLLQRDSTGLTCQNNELRIRLQAMEQQAQLRDAINEALTAEVQRLKLATGEIPEAQISKSIDQQITMNTQIFQPHRLQSQQPNQQASRMPHYQYQPPHQQNNVAAEPEPK